MPQASTAIQSAVMTIEDRYVIDLADLQAIRFECTGCHAALTVSDLQPINLRAECPNCGVIWLRASSREFQALQQLLGSLRWLTKTSPNGGPLADLSGIRIRFELTTLLTPRA